MAGHGSASEKSRRHQIHGSRTGKRSDEARRTGSLTRSRQVETAAGRRLCLGEVAWWETMANTPKTKIPETPARLLLDRCFQDGAPKYIVDIGFGAGTLSRHLERVLRSEYRHLPSGSLPILIGLNPSPDIDHAGSSARVVPGLCDSGAMLAEQLAALGVTDLENAAYIHAPAVDTEPDAAAMAAASLLFDAGSFGTSLKRHGLTVLAQQSALEPSCAIAWMRDPQRLLLALGGGGVFPDAGPAFELGQMADTDAFSAVRFRHRDYSVRLAAKADLPALAALEKSCWAVGSRASSAMIRGRLTRHPAGQLVLENERGLVGAVYSQRVVDDDFGDSTMFTVGKLHEAAGPLALLLALNVLPEMQDRSYGDQLLEFMLQYCAATPGIEAVIGVTRCKDYAKHDGVDLSRYIKLRNEQGRLVDTVLRFHEMHGARIERLVANYRPRDGENGGFGVLVRYEGRRQRKELSVDATATAVPVGADEIESFLATTVATILGAGDGAQVDVARPLFELGMDSADLLDLRERIRATFGVRLEATFFAEYGTCEHIAKHLAERFAQPSAGQDGTAAKPAQTSASSAAGSPPAERRKTPAPKGDAIAIVGMACRLPGGIEDRHSFWNALRDGKDMVGRMPADRWTWPAGIDPGGKHRGIDRGGFIHGVDEFDPLFFRISPKDAALLDPQQRLMLQLAWSCIEDAGYSAHALTGTKTGVYVGASGSDYQLRLYSEQADHIDGHFGLSTSVALLANRISYFFDWNGPSIQIDTACSSSLVAVHEAVSAIKSGMCDQAVAGGVNIMCHPANSVAFYSAGMLSKDGRCKTFGRAADGYVRGEGGAVFLLKPLDAAVDAGDRIHGLIAGTAVNHGGQTAGLTVPSNVRQAALVRQALARADVPADTITYVEAHGTGTALGDPTEVRGLAEAFAGSRRDMGQPYCGLGSVKTNIGHLEAAAGAAGLFKVLLQLQHQTLVRSLHCDQLNPHIRLDEGPFYVVRDSRPWTPLQDEDGDALPRRAGISSFGSGGANAHLIVEEYVAEPAGAADLSAGTGAPAMVVLSAKTEQRLAERARQLLDAIATYPLRDEQLAAVAYTLQVGRQPMDVRLGFLATSISELEATLRAYLGGDAAIEGLHRGKAARNADAPGGAAADSRENLAKWVENGEQARLLELWVKGGTFDWAALYPENKPARLALPTYPFARERYWLPPKPNAVQARPAADAPDAARADFSHPLVQAHASELAERRFLTRFGGDEFFLSDHVVQGRRVLPAVAYLEMARAAVAQSGTETSWRVGIELKDVVWAQSITVDAAALDVAIDLSARDGAVMAWMVSTQAAGGRDDERIVHCQGRAAPLAEREAPVVDIAALQAQCRSTSIPADACYERFRRIGLDYGAAQRSVAELSVGTDRHGRRQVLARLNLPDPVRDHAALYVLHPSILDGALQAALGLELERAQQDGLSLPFAAEAVAVFGPSPSSGWAWVRDSAGGDASRTLRKLDIDICDDDGRTSVALRGFTMRAAPQGEEQRPATMPSDSDAVTLTPAWEATDPAWGDIWPATADMVAVIGGSAARQAEFRAAYPQARLIELDQASGMEAIEDRLREAGAIDHVVWLAPDDPSSLSLGEGMIEGQRRGVLQCFRLIKALLKLGYGDRPLGWTVVTTQSLPVERGEDLNPTHAGVHGLIGSMAKEYPTWRVRLLDMPRGEGWPVADVFRLPADRHGNPLGYRHGEWYRRVLLPTRLDGSGPSPYRRGGVYVVLGGAGGIGEVWTEYMIRAYRAQVVWIGRRAKNAEIQSKIDRLSALGPAPDYHVADASDEAALARVRDLIRHAHGQVHGVVHSAIVLNDSSLARMEEAAFLEALSVKVDGSVHLARVFGRDPLDFALFFSSMLSFKAPPGQSNYAAGCAFKDAFAHRLAQDLPCAVKVMNWGYWGSVGIVASQAYRERMARLGQGSLEPEESMAGLELLLRAGQDQVVLLKPTRPFADEDGVASDEVSVHPAPYPSTLAGLQASVATRAQEMRPERAAGFEEIERLLRRLLWAQLCTLGFPASPTDFAGIKAALGLRDLYDRWLAESLTALTDANYLAYDGTVYWRLACPEADEAAAWREWEARRSLWLSEPALAANVTLLDKTMRALPDILSGATRATDILFPNASMALVEGFYKDNPVADYFNEIVATTVVGFIEQRAAQDPTARIRILEVGAGTGGTSARILERLKGYRDRIDDYCYTDLSRAFLVHGERVFGAENPYFRTRIFDVEKPIADQGFDGGQYDLVVGTNVLHATRNIRRTLRNAKALLRGNGLLLLNEIVETSLFLHLTFGLLEGWWLSEDKSVRLKGSPCLSADAWRRVLKGEGFKAVLFPASQAVGLGQQVVVAESDGLVRQQRHEPAGGAEVAPVPPPSAFRPPQERPNESHVREIVVDKVAQSLGMARERIESDRPFSEYGFDSIVSVGLVNELNQALHIDLPTIAIFDFNTVDRLCEKICTDFADTLRPATAAAEDRRRADPEAAMQDAAIGMPAAAPSGAGGDMQADHVRDVVLDKVAQSLGMARERIESDRPFSEYGFDSIVSVGLVNDINQALGIDLPTIAVFDFNTVDRLCAKICADFGQSIAVSAGDAAPAAKPAAQNVQSSPSTVVELKNILARGRKSKHADAPRPALSVAVSLPKFHHVLLTNPGRIDDIRLVEGTLPDLEPDQVRVAVHAFSLNFGDLLCVSGMYPTMPSYPFTPGFEASGVVASVGSAVTAVAAGDPVIAVMGERLGGQGSVVTCRETQLLRKPDTVSFEEASAFPIVTSTMVGAFSKAELRKGERILIQSAAGGTGLVAVQMAKHRDAEIFATVGSDRKIAYLKELGVHHVFNYRANDFEDEIGRRTAGRGVDVVINTLPADALKKGIRCLSPGGRYVELAMTALRSAKSVDLSIMNNNQSFHSLDLRRLLLDNPAAAMAYMKDGLDLLANRTVSPMIGKIFELEEIVAAYRHLASCESVGKIVVRVPDSYRHGELGPHGVAMFDAGTRSA
ncbi:SDR family NAD(P)-dependent oxidoreductase [Nitratireductor sp. StC3]|uniref:SDR family NAD(P)-dependent oxidoreductase n=1 Tax=Nitratireductor sp. StC3 TaxID=2126741 RepID=UPI0011B20E75|nr:SDR family NAD(P)-dependent oxidoreductase [Nitratireductor sp. StC3]